MAGPEGTLAVTAANAAVMAYKLAAGLIADAVARGEITPEQQQAVRAEFEDIRDHLDEKFSGANWQVVPDPE
jgi:hypothetical protein